MTYLLKMLARQIAFAPDGAGAGAGAGAGDPPPAGAGNPPPAGESATPPASAAPKWWETLPEDQKNYLVATGRTKDDPLEVIPQIIKDYQHAERRLGHKPGDLITKPKEGQNVSEWLAEQRNKLGLPDKADGYKIDAPQDWPKEIPWDTDMAAKVREIAFSQGLPPEAVNAMVGVYAEKILEMERTSAAQLQAATETMMTDLRKDWGQQTDAKIMQAKLAAGVLGEKIGLSGEALQNLTGVLSDKTGDANVLRMFAAIGEMMGDDKGLGLGAGAQTFAMTPADARAEIAKISAPSGDYYKAMQGTDMGEKQRWNKRMADLAKIAAS
jgi:hypothetical protein